MAGDLRKEIFACLDCEMTGLDFQNDRIIEIAVVRFTFEGEISRFTELVDPEMNISEESQAIHGISCETVKNKPKIAEILPSALECIGPYTLVGHGIANDIEMVVRAASSSRIPCDIQNRRFIDTLRLARLYGASPTNSLEGLARHFNIPFDESHRALSDVLTNIEVFKNLALKFKTLDEIFKVLSRPIMMKTMPLGRHKGRPFSEIPLDYLRGAVKMDFDDDLHYSIVSELRKRKGGNTFSQKSNPFLDL